MAKKPTAKSKGRKAPSTAARRVARKTGTKKTASAVPPKTAGKTAQSAARKTVSRPPLLARPVVPASLPPGKIKSPLTRKQLEEFRALLLEKRKSLLGDLTGIESGALGKNLQESAGDLSNMPTHPADIGSDNFEHEFTLGLLESERALLKEINEALERIDQGTYGVCLGTGQPIGLARLQARPWCKYCIEYQKMLEKGLVRPAESSARDSREEDEPENEEEADEEDTDLEEEEAEPEEAAEMEEEE